MQQSNEPFKQISQATVCFSFATRHYVVYNLALESRSMVYHAAKQVAHMTESAVYVMMGLALTTLDTFHVAFFFLVILLTAVGRALNVYPITAMTHFWSRQSKTNPPVGWKDTYVMFHGGLRGGIAYALSINMPIAHTPTADIVHAVVLVFIVFTGNNCVANIF